MILIRAIDRETRAALSKGGIESDSWVAPATAAVSLRVRGDGNLIKVLPLPFLRPVTSSGLFDTSFTVSTTTPKIQRRNIDMPSKNWEDFFRVLSFFPLYIFFGVIIYRRRRWPSDRIGSMPSGCDPAVFQIRTDGFRSVLLPFLRLALR